jgi:peroxiredoxin (alkyl hydroperoxide reductase subunit C)
MVLVGKQAPDFTTSAVLADGTIIENFNLYQTIQNKYALLFFYPLDFTFVCPSELIALNNRIKLFQERGVEVIGASIDSHYTHNAWRNTAVSQGGIGKLNYTLVADLNHKIVQAYGIEHPEVGVALRGTFVIDKNKTIMHQTVNALPLGRNIDEFVRLIDALQFHEQHGEVCPAGWNKGSKSMKPTPDGVATYLEAEAKSL